MAYGYLWWVIDEKVRRYAALGDGGNVIYINAGKRIVVSIATILVPEVEDRVDFIETCIEPLLED